MKTRLVDSGWSAEMIEALHEGVDDLLIISPFIKASVLQRLLATKPTYTRVITRFNLSEFAEGVSDIAALRDLLLMNGAARGIKNLHAKMYLFGSKRAMVTSANLTEAALSRNHEFGLVSEDTEIVAACQDYFEDLWERGGSSVSLQQLDQWEELVTDYRAKGGCSGVLGNLADYGADAGGTNLLPALLPVVVTDAAQAFVKFLGEGNNRVPLSFSTFEEVERAGCHWAVAYPASKRPRSVSNNAVVFIGRLTYDPNDIRVFGRAIGMSHLPGRDDATPEDIARRNWKADWPRYIRVHHAQFVAGTMANGISLNELMNTLSSDSFASTQRNDASGLGNTDPRKAYRQQAAVELSREGAAWLGEKLQAAFDRYGIVPKADLDQLDWP